ncbi:hypothetical protein ACEW7V_02160 [Areca yellow leaf disease phytoplasma]|uniref:hypothetical protein n=1 Tax=Areca yellow leaf disease phytoplasma TaxID=927614 RepID=UPI0035B51BC8
MSETLTVLVFRFQQDGFLEKPVPLSENRINPVLLKMGIINKPDYKNFIGKKVEIISGFSGQINEVSSIDDDVKK